MKRLRVGKKLCFAGLLLFTLSAGGLWLYRDHAATVEVNAGLFTTALGIDRVITPTLSDTLKNNPQAKKFRLRWVLLGNPKGPLHCRIDYDRSSKQLSELSIHTGMEHPRLYTNVTDNAIQQVARKGRPLHLLQSHGAKIVYQPGLLGLVKRYRFRRFGW